MLARFVQSLPDGIAQRLTALYFRALATVQQGAHSAAGQSGTADMEVVAVPAFRDNYMYLVTDRASGRTAAVDPAQPAALLQEVAARGLELALVLVTHHHADHAGGTQELLAARPGLPVLAGDARVPGHTRLLRDGEETELGALRVTALATPAHTRGSLCFLVRGPGEGGAAVLTGDTLFSAGCGRLFEGTGEQLLAAMDRLGALPGDTAVYPGHEYTEANLKFAAHVMPESEAVRRAAARARDLRERGLPTVPSSVAEELETNPFLRARSPELAQGETDPVLVITKLRRQKDDF